MDTNRNTQGSTPGATASGSTTGSAGGAGRSGSQSGSETGKQGVQDKAREAAHEAQHKAAEQVRSGLDMAKSRAASSLHGVADSLLQSCETNQSGATRYIQQAGERMQSAADYLERTDVREIVNHTERFARRQPALFLGGAFGLGLLAARFLKSSRRGEQQEIGSGYNAWEDSTRGLYERERPVSGYREAGLYGAGAARTGTGASSAGGSTGASTGMSGTGAGTAGRAAGGLSAGAGLGSGAQTGGTSGGAGGLGASGTSESGGATSAGGGTSDRSTGTKGSTPGTSDRNRR